MEVAQYPFFRPRIRKTLPRKNNNMVTVQKYLPRNKHDDTEDVYFYDDKLKVTVTKSAQVVNNWFIETRETYGMRSLIVGLDIEWLPNLNPEEGEDHPVATLQLCIDRRCLIFQLLHRDSMPAYLSAFLMNENHCFAGVGVVEDAKKLFLHHGLHVFKMVDLNQLACWVFRNPEFGRVGLKRMAKAILRKDVAKPPHVTLSKWDAEALSFEQIEYAAIDAFVSFELAKMLPTIIVFKN